MNQMRPVAKRDNLYTLSLFALKSGLKTNAQLVAYATKLLIVRLKNHV